jgi:hypothetical protein
MSDERMRNAHVLATICDHLDLFAGTLESLPPEDVNKFVPVTGHLLRSEVDVLRRYCEENGIDWRAADRNRGKAHER